MSQYRSFFVNAVGDSSQCDELNHFLSSHVVIRVIENIISSSSNCGIQLLVEYKNSLTQSEKSSKQRIDYRAELKTEQEREIFDKLKEIRLGLAKSKNLKAAYLVCKDEHLAAIIKNPKITEEEIKNLPHSANILLKDFASSLFSEYQKILQNVVTTKSEPELDEACDVPF